jgi:hypothetical protein
MLIWSIAPRGDVEERIHEAVDVVLGAVTTPTPAPTGS